MVPPSPSASQPRRRLAGTSLGHANVEAGDAGCCVATLALANCASRPYNGRYRPRQTGERTYRATSTRACAPARGIPFDDAARTQRNPHACWPRHPHGRPHARVLDPGVPARRTGGGCAPHAAPAAGREAHRVSRYCRARRHHGPPLPASLRVDVLRAQRRQRPPLRVSRLEVRRERSMRRHAQHPGRSAVQVQGQGAGVPDARAWRARLGLHGRARRAAAVA